MRRTLFAVIGLAFFFAPVGLRAVGVTAHPFENRPLATFPKASQGWDAFDQATRFFVDRLPLREPAVHANTSISQHVFHTTPVYGRAAAGALPFGSPGGAAKGATGKAGAPAATAGIPAKGQPGTTVLPGKDGWLFLEEELGRACTVFIPWPAAIHRWERAAQIIRASGRRVAIVVAPDKSTMYPDKLPAKYAESACGPAGHAAAWRAIEGSRDPALLPLRRALLAVPHDPPDETYFAKDTHWNTKGGTLAVQRLLAGLDAGVAIRPDEITRAHGPYTGDLTNLIGAPETDQSPVWTIARPGVAPAAASVEQLPAKTTARLLTRPAGGRPLLPGRTLFIDDSFGEAMQDALGAYTTSLSILPWYTAVPLPPEAMIEAIRRADNVVLETVERDLSYKASEAGAITPAFLKRLRRELPAKR